LRVPISEPGLEPLDRSAYFPGAHGGAELDLLLLQGGRPLGFEFKFSDQPGTTKSMRTALQDLALEQLYVAHPGEHEFPACGGNHRNSATAAD
jgi:hypothetical protein